MPPALRNRLSFSNVVAVLALFVALGGSSYAVTRIGSKQIVNNSVRSKDLRNNDIRSGDVRNRSLLSRDFKSGQLPKGATGPAGPAGRSALTPLRSGEVVRGAWGVGRGDGNNETHATAVTLPLPAPVPIDSAHAVVGGNDVVDGHGCTGTAAAPAAGPGFACVYLGGSEGTLQGLSAFGTQAPNMTDPARTGDGSTGGFVIRVQGTMFKAWGTWIYRAP